MNAGKWTYNHSGYYDSTYGKCRTVYRLKSLLTDSGYQSATAANITSAKFYVKEATGSAGVTVNLHAMTGNTTWTELGITWNNAGSYSSTVYASASPSYNNWATWDITSLVKAWKNGGQNPNAGFILVSTNETSIDKAFYSSEFGTTSYWPYVVVSYTENTSGLNYTSKDVDEGSTFQLTWSGVSSGITWTSSNLSVAVVNSSGKVTGVKAGTATITASATGHTSVTCTVTVTLPYGIYYINPSSGYSIGTGGTQTNQTQIMTYTQITSGTSKYHQLWEIKHISDSKYSIRSIGNGSLLLYRSGSNAVVYKSSPTAAVPSQALWKIEYTTKGYKLLNNGSTSYALTVNGSDTSTGQFITTTTYSSTSAQAHWQLQILNGVVLLDADTRTVLPETTVKTLLVDSSQNQGQLGVAAVRTGNGAGALGITWSSSDTSIATINTTTGAVTGRKRGKTTIKASITISGTTYTQQYTVYVMETVYVINIYDKTVAGNNEILGNIDDAVDFLNLVYKDFYLQFEMDGDLIQNPNDPIAQCLRGSSLGCDSYCTSSELFCPSHHKNVNRIGDELVDLYHEENHVIVNWSNCTANAYCEFLNSLHSPIDAIAAVPFYEASAEDLLAKRINPYPFAMFLTFDYYDPTQFEDNGYSMLAYVSMALAHEIGHTLGLAEVYNNYYGDCTNLGDHGKNQTTITCIMGKFNESSYELYQNISDYGGGLCDYCIGKLNIYIPDDIYPAS